MCMRILEIYMLHMICYAPLRIWAPPHLDKILPTLNWIIKYSLISMTSHVSRMNIYKVYYLPGRQVGSMFASFHH